MVGHWPFRKIRAPSFSDLLKVHASNGITCGYVSSLNSVFYNDPFEGDIELHDIIGGSGYEHILTVNPTLPGYMDDIETGIKKFNAKGVKIFPGIHGYSLDSIHMSELCNMLKHFNLPLFIVKELENIRFHYIFVPAIVEMAEIGAFLEKQHDLRVLLLSVSFIELSEIKGTLRNHPGVYYDTARLFAIGDIVNELGADRMVYGSQHPLLCLKSTLLGVKNADFDDTVKNQILETNGYGLIKEGGCLYDY